MHLTHPNGWWRDTAQQLLVLKRDKSVVPALERLARTSTNLPGRFHALWTLEGLGALDAGLARQLMEDTEPRMRIQAIRASETLYKAGDQSFAADYRALTKDSSVDVAIQAMLTLNRWKVPGAADTLKAMMERRKERGVQVVATTFLNAAANAGRGRGGIPLVAEQQNLLTRGGEVYNSLCITCHGPDGTGVPSADGKSTMETSSDGKAWKTAAEGKDAWHDVVSLSSGGTGVQESVASSIIPFAPVTAKFVRITQTESTENPPVWSVQSLRLFEAAKPAR